MDSSSKTHIVIYRNLKWLKKSYQKLEHTCTNHKKSPAVENNQKRILLMNS